MSNSIWKTADQKPTSGKCVCIYDGFEYYVDIANPDCWDSMFVEKWCDFHDLITQADKVERLQKVMDLALAELHEIDEVCDDYKYTDNLYVGLDGHDTCNIALDVKKTITQITALTKGGSNE